MAAHAQDDLAGLGRRHSGGLFAFGCACGLLTLLFFMGLVLGAIWNEPPKVVPCESRFLVVAVLSLGAALSSAVIGGSAAAEGRLPLPFVRKHPLRVSLVGGVAVFVIVLLVGHRLYAAPEKCQESIDVHVKAMISNFQHANYADAMSKAEDVLRLDPTNGRAMNVKAAVLFYRRQYGAALDWFEKSAKYLQTPIVFKNLADAYVETAAYAKAIENYDKADPSQEVRYAVGRTYLFWNNPDEALKRLEPISSTVQRGSARILVAAALAGKSAGADMATRAKLVEEARRQLLLGCSQDPAHWTAILSGNKQDIHESHDLVIKYLDPILDRKRPCANACS